MYLSRLMRLGSVSAQPSSNECLLHPPSGSGLSHSAQGWQDGSAKRTAFEEDVEAVRGNPREGRAMMPTVTMIHVWSACLAFSRSKAPRSSESPSSAIYIAPSPPLFFEVTSHKHRRIDQNAYRRAVPTSRPWTRSWGHWFSSVSRAEG